MKSYEITRATAEEKQYLATAGAVYLDAYVKWVRLPPCYFHPVYSPTARTQTIPIERQEQCRNEGGDPRGLITPVHFGFFMLCYGREPQRPLSSITPNDFFWHPIFTLDRYNGPPALILPTYFFNPSATFNGLTAPEYQPYPIFPFFAKTLFEWLNEGDARGDFPNYSLSRYAPWTPRAGVQTPPTLARPHQVVKKHWRWVEVLWMLEEDA